MRLAFLCSEYPPDSHGGIGVMVRAMAENLAQRGDRVSVVGFSPQGARREEIGGVRIHRLAKPRSTGIPHVDAVIERMALARKLSAVAEDEQWQVLEVPDWKGEAAFLARIPIPVVCRLHGSTTALAIMQGRRASTLTTWFERRTLSRSDQWIAISQVILAATQSAIPRMSRPATVLANFSPPPPPAPPGPRDPNLFIYVGRCTRAKGLALFLASAGRVLARLPHTRCEIAGEEVPSHETVASMIAGMPKEWGGRVEYRGRLDREALDELYRRAACVVIPSRAEAFGLVAVEAMARGCVPVVLARTGPAEVLANGGGVIVDEPSSGALAKAVVRLLVHTGERQRLSEEAVLKSSVYTDVDARMDENRRLYASLIAAREGRQ